MRAWAAAALSVGLVGLGMAVVISGRAVEPLPEPEPVASSIKADPPKSTARPLSPDDTGLHARAVGEELVALPPVEPESLLREDPRAPLSVLSQALPLPKPKISVFYRPVATGSATFESMGYKLAIAGTQSVAPEDTCTTDGVAWGCGMRARTAVRMWLRGRALTCGPPPDDADKKAAPVSCTLGNQDVGAWLVSNGWARALPGGPYIKAEEKAREARMGIFAQAPEPIPELDQETIELLADPNL